MKSPYPKAAKLFIISAPSGCGKTTLCNKLLEDGLGLANSVSMTTRKPRRGEERGVDYRFVSESVFKKTAKEKGFLEYEENFGSWYGTPRRFVEENIKKGRPVLLSIDVKGAMKVKKVYRNRNVLIFLIPPSIGELKKRLQSRRADRQEDIARRLGIAKKEIGYKDRYDYVVVNDKLDKAYKRLKKIIVSELEK